MKLECMKSAAFAAMALQRTTGLRRTHARTLFAMLGLAAFWAIASAAQASSFTPGDLVIYRVGDGSLTLANTGNPVFLDEYTPTGTLVQSIPMPTAASGGNNGFWASGTATSEGALSLSPDGQFLALTGYSNSGSTSIVSSSSSVNPRVVGLVTSSGSINTTTALTDFSNGNNPRSAVTTDGNSIWVGGATGGVRYATAGATTSTQLSTTVTNIRVVNVFNGQLYSSDSSGSTVRLGAVGTGLPTTSGQTITNLPGFPTSGSPYGYYFADLSPSVPGVDTLYVADDGASGGIQKYSLVSGSWTANGTVTASGVRGLTGTVVGGSVDLFGTTGGAGATGGGSLYSFVDSTGYNASISGAATTLATASANEAFRGVAFAPAAVPEPGTWALLCVGGCCLFVRRALRGKRLRS